MRDEMGLEYTVDRLHKLETRLKNEQAELIPRFLEYDDLSQEDRAGPCGSRVAEQAGVWRPGSKPLHDPRPI
jgi:hypothetical protein